MGVIQRRGGNKCFEERVLGSEWDATLTHMVHVLMISVLVSAFLSVFEVNFYFRFKCVCNMCASVFSIRECSVLSNLLLFLSTFLHHTCLLVSFLNGEDMMVAKSLFSLWSLFRYKSSIFDSEYQVIFVGCSLQNWYLVIIVLGNIIYKYTQIHIFTRWNLCA